MLALTWVHSGTGVKLPVAEIATAVANRAWDLDVARPLFCLDAVHGFGIANQTPGELGCDVFVSGAHKWLFGPRSTGIVWAKPQAWEQIRPTIPSFDQESLGSWIRGVKPEFLTPGGANSPGGFKAFRAPLGARPSPRPSDCSSDTRSSAGCPRTACPTYAWARAS